MIKRMGKGGNQVHVDAIDSTRINKFHIVDKIVLGEKFSNNVYALNEEICKI